MKLSQNKNLSNSQLQITPAELCEADDIATTLVVDQFLGFTTHKMNTRYASLSPSLYDTYLYFFNLRFRSPKIPKDYLKNVILKFKDEQQQDYELVLNQILGGEWAHTL